MTEVSQPLFLFGPGFSATALAAIWTGHVVATARSDEKALMLQSQGIDPIRLTDAGAMSNAASGAHLLVSAPPDENGCPGYRALQGVSDQFASVTYLSTTGVYGDLGGGWAFEWTRPAPASERARRRRMAETAWQTARSDTRIVRLPGIYGRGRSTFDRLRKGSARRVVKPGQVFSRIHVDDLASGLKLILPGQQTGVFHLCDDEAAPPQDVVTYAADLLGMDAGPEINFEAAELSAMGRSFYSECKRVSNARVKAAYGWQPRFPTYREGLAAVFAQETAD